jgi:ATP-dependent Lon protease
MNQKGKNFVNNSIKNMFITKSSAEFFKFIDEKILYMKEIIRNTISSINKNQHFEIFSNSDINISINTLIEIYDKTDKIANKIKQIQSSTSNQDKKKYFLLNDVNTAAQPSSSGENMIVHVPTDNNDITEQKDSITLDDSKNQKKQPSDLMIEQLQKLVDKLSMIICGFGTKYINDLLFISFGSEYKNIKIENPIIQAKYELIINHIQPIGYKIINWKQIKPTSKAASSSSSALSCKINSLTITDNSSTVFSTIKGDNGDSTIYCSNKITEESIHIEESNMFECFDMDMSMKQFYLKVYGIQIVIQNEKLKKTLIIHGIIDDIHLECFNNLYIDNRKTELRNLFQSYKQEEQELLNEIVENMSLKDILIQGNQDIFKKMVSVITEKNTVKNTRLDMTIKKFMELQPYYQRNMIINLLLCNTDDEIKYICYILYEILSISNTEMSEDVNHIYNYLPWKLKNQFKDIIKHTTKFTNNMSNKYDVSKITLEHQIYLMKAPENIKEKAYAKLKELKGKNDESNSKTRQYIEGLINIPFGIYKEEPILKKMKDMNKSLNKVFSTVTHFFPEILKEGQIVKKEKYTNHEIAKYSQYIENYINTNIINKIESSLRTLTTKQITPFIQYINQIKKTKKEDRIAFSNQPKELLIQKVVCFLKENCLGYSFELFQFIQRESQLSFTKTLSDITGLYTHSKSMDQSITAISDILDDSIHGHEHAKNQIMKIIGQWIHGEQTGYCFGFEGSPGVGKTSLAKKGLANCLIDENNTPRPFAFIALGGSCNGSTIEGHGYTYMNSTWGRIVDVLMESKCMNPIIYIDELDKVSKTENGREIIGILTHLIDSTQNDSFQDKYFSGINIDLSKALIIFSYNDVDQIDRVLLDRIHRIKFDNLDIQEKIVIVKKHILPDINNKMGFENIVTLSDAIIEHIIVYYTNEPGVRKLKEILFDLYGEINLSVLKSKFEQSLPVEINIDDLENNYLKKYNKIVEQKIHQNSKIGLMNGLWANMLGRGGIIPIEAMYFPSSTFLELKLTGLQGDVMKESMNVAKTLAWNMTPKDIKMQLIDDFETTKSQGIHIHCPEGAISKDGPSAGAAIVSTLFSLFNQKKIRHDVAMTGEINLQGEITEIGGLDIKINGGIRAGVKTFLYPKGNHKDFMKWKEKNKDNHNDILFHKVENIQQVFDFIFEE